MEKEFNLLDEPWIRVMKRDCCVEELSLTDALLHAQEYTDLAGELPTQNAAVLRLLLAVLHAVFGKYNEKGEEQRIENEDDALDLWKALWDAGSFPEKPIRKYLDSQKEKFWLFHPERPFWQIPVAFGTEYEASKLNGALSESSNKLRLFPDRTGELRNRLTYAEAARWLLYVNAYDDTSAKPTKAGKIANEGKLPSPGAGWVGKLGFVKVCGNNFFETLMQNLVLLNEKDEPWSNCIPEWEHENVKTAERTMIVVPNDQAALLTLQSRRMLLKRQRGFVTGYYLIGGDFFDKENCFSEQMTVWGFVKDKKGNIVGHQPKRHNSSLQMWRDFSSYTSTALTSHIPGVIRWNSYLQRMNILPRNKTIYLGICAIQYGDKDFFAADTFADSLSFSLGLVADFGESCRNHVINEVERCERIAKNLNALSSDLFLAAGGDVKKKGVSFEKAKERYYCEIDIPFRKWLVSLDAEGSGIDERVCAWRKQAESIAYRIAKEMVQNAGPGAYVGKIVKIEKDSDGRYYSSSLAMKWFKIKMSKL